MSQKLRQWSVSPQELFVTAGVCDRRCLWPPVGRQLRQKRSRRAAQGPVKVRLCLCTRSAGVWQRRTPDSKDKVKESETRGSQRILRMTLRQEAQVLNIRQYSTACFLSLFILLHHRLLCKYFALLTVMFWPLLLTHCFNRLLYCTLWHCLW